MLHDANETTVHARFEIDVQYNRGHGEAVAFERDRRTAFDRARKIAAAEPGNAVFVFDRMARRGQVQTWKVRPNGEVVEVESRW